METGDIVLFKHSSELPYWQTCIVTGIDDTSCTLIGSGDYGRYNLFKKIDLQRVVPISELENVRAELEKQYELQIEAKISEIRNITFDEKEKEKMARYNSTKGMIVANCKKILDEDITEEEFVNRVKTLAQLKTQLFSPQKLECVSIIHRHNGTVKYECRKLIAAKQDAMNKISDRAVQVFCEEIGRSVEKGDRHGQ